MQATDLATAGFISEQFQAILAQLQAMQHLLPQAGADMPRLLTIEQVMEHCGVSRSAVQRWMNKGKPGRNGSIITLQAYSFGTSEPRIPWPALAAFGQGLPFDLDSLSNGAAPAASASGYMRKAS